MTSTPHTIPLADLGHLTDLARRTRRLRLGVATAAVGAAAAALVVALWSKPQTTAFPQITALPQITACDQASWLESSVFPQMTALPQMTACPHG